MLSTWKREGFRREKKEGKCRRKREDRERMRNDK
jgi:hypothetical protein